MNLILLGAPGAGKGTQAARITEKYKIPAISTGDIFRKNIKEGTEVGLKAKSYIDSGALVPDDVVIEIVGGRLKELDCADGFLLDGFPRTVNQAEALAKITKIDRVINIDIELNKLMARLTGRRVCGACGTSFHISTYTKAECDKCNAELIIRPDDAEATVKSRLDTYTRQTAPLISFYKQLGLLVTVDGDKNIDEVFADIVKTLK